MRERSLESVGTWRLHVLALANDKSTLYCLSLPGDWARVNFAANIATGLEEEATQY